MGDEAFLDWVEDQLKAVSELLQHLSKKDDGDIGRRIDKLHPEVLRTLSLRLGLELDSKNTSKLKSVANDAINSEILEIEAALALSDRLRSRHYYQLAFEVSAEADDLRRMDISQTYMQGHKRTELMREIEQHCHLPLGSILVHCPRRETNFKAAEVFVLYAPDRPAMPLKDADKAAPQLKRFASRARDMANDYMSIWKLRVFLHKGYSLFAPSVSDYLRSKLEVSNSDYLESAQKHDANYVLGSSFLNRHGGEDGRRMLAEAVKEIHSSRKGMLGQRVSFEECLKRQEKIRDIG